MSKRLRVAVVVDGVGHRKAVRGDRLWAGRLATAFVLGATFLLAGCGEIGRLQTAGPAPSAPVAKPKSTFVQSAAAEKEHERILSSYGGAYDDPKLEALIGKTVDRLVAASDRPDQAYKVTILNSGAVNAFALPNGQLYVTRGLIALASTSCWREKVAIVSLFFASASAVKSGSLATSATARVAFAAIWRAWSSRMAACLASTCAISWLSTEDSSEVSQASAISPRVT